MNKVDARDVIIAFISNILFGSITICSLLIFYTMGSKWDIWSRYLPYNEFIMMAFYMWLALFIQAILYIGGFIGLKRKLHSPISLFWSVGLIFINFFITGIILYLSNIIPIAIETYNTVSSYGPTLEHDAEVVSIIIYLGIVCYFFGGIPASHFLLNSDLSQVGNIQE